MCAALARYEDTLRGALCEVHGDLSAFKRGVERRLAAADEPLCRAVARLQQENGPLCRAVARLQQENGALRAQLDALARQVELLAGMRCEHRRSSSTASSSTASSITASSTNQPPSSRHHHNYPFQMRKLLDTGCHDEPSPDRTLVLEPWC